MKYCDKCDGSWRARYRRDRAPRFYCERCGRRKPAKESGYRALAVLRTDGGVDVINLPRVSLMTSFNPQQQSVANLLGGVR